MDSFLAPNTPRSINIVSYVLVSLMITSVLYLHLLPAAISGMMVYTLTRTIEKRLLAQRTWSNWARMLSIATVITLVCLLVAGIVLGIVGLVQKHHGFSGLLLTVADIVTSLRDALPASIQPHIPEGIEELRLQLAALLKTHGQQVSTLGYGGVKAAILALIGLVVGAMVSWSDHVDPAHHRPLSGALLQRLSLLTHSFQTVVFAQVRISTLNTVLTTLYLAIFLPAFGFHLPYTKSLIALTFVVGLMPVVGNLISNTFILLVSSSISLEVAGFSLVFLIVIHKLEYFVNAKIIGFRIDARAWELILAMTAMESAFGIGGVIAAPVLYAYLKRELEGAGLIGLKRS